jgi:hypothetical protein
VFLTLEALLMLADLIARLAAVTDGKKTYVAALGLALVAGYQAVALSDYAGAGESLSLALGLVGIRRKLSTL